MQAPNPTTAPPPAFPPGANPWQPVLGPRPPTAFERRWPGPLKPAAPVVAGAAAATGVVAAASVPLDRPGLGWLVTGLAGAAALITLSRRDGYRPIQPLWAAATLALLGVGALRAADWLFTLCVLTAAVTGALAVARARSAPALVLAVAAVPAAALRALPWIAQGLSALARRRRDGAPARIGAAAAVAALLVLVFGALFATADAAFAELVGRLLPDAEPPDSARGAFLFGAGAAGVLTAAYLLAGPPDLSGVRTPPGKSLRRVEWALPLVAVNAVFAVFVAVQLAVWFGGAAHVLRTAGLTYAEYARKGFWQLLVVTALTLGVLALAARWAPREGRADRILVRALLGALAALCLVVVASALYRMHTYEEAYGFTRLRVLVSICELWLGLVLAMVLVAVVRLRARWLPAAVTGSAVAALIGLAALNPDHFIAERNVARYADSGRIDAGYLSRLSADAAPALDRLPDPLRGCVLGEIAADLANEPDGWREWNLGRERAGDVLAAAPVTPGTWADACGYRW
ncbi:DUF4173 domain-containing protein [Actinomycetes bacterium KLBMP 9797]